MVLFVTNKPLSELICLKIDGVGLIKLLKSGHVFWFLPPPPREIFAPTTKKTNKNKEKQKKNKTKKNRVDYSFKTQVRKK